MIELSKLKITLWHTSTIDNTTFKLDSSLKVVLSNQEAKSRLDQFDQNSLTEEKKESLWKDFIEELRDPVVLMLLVTGVLYPPR